MPTAFDLARIVAVPGDADSYRPIAPLQVRYKLYETLILNRLKLGVGGRIHSYQFGSVRFPEQALCRQRSFLDLARHRIYT